MRECAVLARDKIIPVRSKYHERMAYFADAEIGGSEISEYIEKPAELIIKLSRRYGCGGIKEVGEIRMRVLKTDSAGIAY